MIPLTPQAPAPCENTPRNHQNDENEVDTTFFFSLNEDILSSSAYSFEDCITSYNVISIVGDEEGKGNDEVVMNAGNVFHGL